MDLESGAISCGKAIKLGVAAVGATMTSARLEGVRCVAAGIDGVLRLATVEMGVIVAAETSVAHAPESADSGRRVLQRLRSSYPLRTVQPTVVTRKPWL
jgi:hypothetical protein